MKDTTISIKVTNVSYVKLFNDGGVLADNIKLVGSYSMRSAEKFISDGKSCVDLANIKTIKVIEVVKGVEKYSVDTNKLYNFILSEGLENEC